MFPFHKIWSEYTTFNTFKILISQNQVVYLLIRLATDWSRRREYNLRLNVDSTHNDNISDVNFTVSII